MTRGFGDRMRARKTKPTVALAAGMTRDEKNLARILSSFFGLHRDRREDLPAFGQAIALFFVL